MNGVLSFFTGGFAGLLAFVIFKRVAESTPTEAGTLGFVLIIGLLALFCIAFAITLTTGAIEELTSEIKKGRKE